MAGLDFLTSYRNREAQLMQQPMRELQQASALQGIIQQAQAAQMKQQALATEGQFRAELAALGPNPDQNALAQVAAKYAAPKDVLTTQQSSLDRQAQREMTVANAASQREQRLFEIEQRGAQELERIKQQAVENRITREEADKRAASLKMTLLQATAALRPPRAERQLQLTTDENGNQLIVNPDRTTSPLLRDDGTGVKRPVRTQQSLQTGVYRFANDLQQNKIPGIHSSMSTANDLLRKYEDKEIPGIGIFTGSKKIPDALRGEEAKNVRSSLQAVSNDLLNLYSGLAVTLPEAERRELEEMRNGSFGDKDFKNAWPRIVNRYNTVKGNLAAGAGPEILKEYESRPGAISMAPLKAAFDSNPASGSIGLPDASAIDAEIARRARKQ